MILLSGHSLTAAQVVPVETMSLQLKERESTASMTPASIEGIGVDSWLKDDRDPGAGIVWRVRSIQQVYNTDTPTVQLEHVISSLKDRILFGEVTPTTITGTEGATTCTAKQAVQFILGQQSDWTLGDFDYDDVSNPYKFDGDSLFDALETVTASLDDAYWTYDMSSYPFELNIIEHSAIVGSEMRAGRNLRTISRTVDKSGMYTRFYPIGKDDLHLQSEYVEKNTGMYGVISKVETDQSLTTAAELTAWANERLNLHAQPTVTITAEGFELSRETGEPLDALTIGRVCRVPLPEFGTTIEERIVEISYQDKVNMPEVVRVTLANSRQDVTRIIADALKKSGRSSRGAARKDKEDLAWFEDTNDHVAMCAIGIIGVDAQCNPNWTRMSEFIADGEGLHAKVETQMQDVTDRVASLEISESEIRTDVAASNSQIYSYIIQTASSINTRVSNQTNRVWIQDSDPRNSGHTPKAGDIWVESTHQGTWDGAEGFDWEHDEDYDWTQIQGAKVWGWQNDKWELVSDQQQVVTMTDVEQTSEHIVQRAIKAMVNDEGNLSVYRAELMVEGDRIRSEVHEATSQIYSFILQTASQITIRVGESNMVFSGMTQPTGTSDHPLVDGDLWIKTSFQRTWSDMEELDAWIDDEDFDWSDLKGSTIYVYDAELGEFREVLDEQVLAQDTDIDETAEKISLIARSVKQVDGKVDVYRGEFQVRADRITSTLNQRIEGVGSSITQTASQIRAEVHAAQSSIYSSITQTASQIRAEVVDTTNSLSSAITQTASQIRSEVNAAKSTIYSSITQTASQIRSEVANSISGVQSSITQTASQIRSDVSAAQSTIWSSIIQSASKIALVVDGSNNIKAAQIVASINNGSSSIIISANHINLDGYVKATDITADYIKGKIASISSVSMQSLVASSIQFSVGGGLYGNPANAIMNLQLYRSGNSYQIWGSKFNGEIVKTDSFSRAVSSWDWTGGNGQVKVTAQPQNQTLGVDVRVNGDATITSNGTYTYKAQYEDDNGSYWDIGGEGTKTITVSVPASVPSDLGIYDILSQPVSSKTISPGGSIDLWAGCNVGQSGETWGSKVTITAGSYGGRTFRCTGKEQTYPGSTTYKFTFTLEGNYSFSSGNNYTFYRSSWS